MRRITVSISEAHWQEIRRKARRRGVTASQLMREAAIRELRLDDEHEALEDLRHETRDALRDIRRRLAQLERHRHQ
jgi:hypothetical protein